jgi:sarcosine oxidase subunit beta
VIFRQVERGNVIVGFYPRGPADRVANRAPVPPAKALHGLANMARVVPMLRGAQVIRVWAGIEGYLPDMLPVMGWSRTTKNLLHGFGFCGHGFQLSPGVGYTLAEMIDEGQAKIPIDAFAIDRFAKFQPDQERLTGEFDAALASAALGSTETRVTTP